MRNETLVSLSVLGVLSLSLPVSARTQDALPSADVEVTAAELRHHVEFLASDELAGRATGSPGLKRAADYLASSFERAGLEPGGDDGSFLQGLVLTRIVHSQVPELKVVLADGSEFEALYGRDWDYSVRGEARSTGVLSLTHVRSLDELPEASDGKRALLLDGSRRERGDWLTAREMGSGEDWGMYVRIGSKREGAVRTEVPRSSMRVKEDNEAGSDPCDMVRVRGALLEAINENRVSTLELSVFAKEELMPDQNVVGVRRGVGTEANPELAGETIVISAHIDHIGVKSEGAEGEDLVYNGADDDASGVAAVLAIADALASGPPPARTLVYLLATGEEIGLIGTYWYLDHPVVPLESTVCNLNFEMIGRADDLVGGSGKLWLTGYDKTNLGPLFNGAGLTIVADQRLDQNFYQRSDNYAFVKRGIIGQTLSSYNLHEDYHHVTDEADTLDYEHMEIAVQSCVEAVRLLASGEVTPTWSEE